jgi:hypothetical protein
MPWASVHFLAWFIMKLMVIHITVIYVFWHLTIWFIACVNFICMHQWLCVTPEIRIMCWGLDISLARHRDHLFQSISQFIYNWNIVTWSLKCKGTSYHSYRYCCIYVCSWQLILHKVCVDGHCKMTFKDVRSKELIDSGVI